MQHSNVSANVVTIVPCRKSSNGFQLHHTKSWKSLYTMFSQDTIETYQTPGRHMALQPYTTTEL